MSETTMDVKERINLEKIGNALIYFARNTCGCGVTKASKLLYYLDCYHIEKHGRHIIQDVYYKLPEGPVPSNTYNRIKSIIELRYGTEDIQAIKDAEFHEKLADFIDVKIEVLDAEKRIYRYRIVPKKKFSAESFSKSELDSLRQVARDYKYTTAKELSEKSHRELPCKVAAPNGVVELKLYAKERVSPKKYKEIEYIEGLTESLELNYG